MRLFLLVLLTLTFLQGEGRRILTRRPLPFVGEVRWMTFTTLPEGWLMCQGQEVKVSDYKDLFKVIGSRFGGDGKNSFRLPDLTAVSGAGTQGRDIPKLHAMIAQQGVLAMRHYS